MTVYSALAYITDTWSLSTGRGGLALFIYELPNGARPQRPACLNSKLSHLINQRSARQSQPIGRPVLPSDHPVGLLQCFEDMLPIGVGQGACSAIRALRQRLL